MAEPVKIENPSKGQRFLAPQFDRDREGPQNSAALRRSKPSKGGSWGSRLSASCCHKGKSKRQPHHDAQVVRKTFLPRSSERRCGTPARSGKAKSGASRPARAAVRLSVAVPNTQTSPSKSDTTGYPRVRQNAATSTLLPRSASPRSGTQS